QVAVSASAHSEPRPQGAIGTELDERGSPEARASSDHEHARSFGVRQTQIKASDSRGSEHQARGLAGAGNAARPRQSLRIKLFDAPISVFCGGLAEIGRV